jgi:hypothetical protein
VRALSGLCEAGAAHTRRGLLADALGFHLACAGARCLCACHSRGGPETVDQAVSRLKRQRMLDAGIDPDAPPTKRAKERGFCRWEHEMTPENTGPRGECRSCKRIASQRCKERKAARAAREKGEADGQAAA